MSEELDILKIVEENPNMSQRKIAEKTGISLGQVNFLIKKCVKKGLIKIEGQTSKSLKYNLTPQGIAEKATLTLEYVKVSYNAVNRLTNKIIDIVEKYENEDLSIIVCGSKDEMMDIVKLAIGNRANYLINYSNMDNNNTEAIFLCWDANIINNLKKIGLKAVNILE